MCMYTCIYTCIEKPDFVAISPVTVYNTII